MNKKFVLFFVFLMSASFLNGALRPRITIPKACKEAPIIVVAEIVRHQYESMADGEKRRLDQYSLWNDYKILDVLKNQKKHAKISIGKILQIGYSSNVGIRDSIYVTRKKDSVEIKYFCGNDRYETKLYPISKFTKNLHSKVILFLRPIHNSIEVDKTKSIGTVSPERHNSLKFDNTEEILEPLSQGPKKPYEFNHYGWSFSPVGYTDTILKKIKALISQSEK